LLAAAGDQHLIGLVAQAVVALKLVDNRLLQAGRAVNGGIFGEARVDRLNGGLLDVIGSIEVGFAGSQPDDVFAQRLELFGPGGDGQSGRWLNTLNTMRKLRLQTRNPQIADDKK